MILGGFLDEHLLWKCNIQTLATKTMVTLHAQDISILQIIHKQQKQSEFDNIGIMGKCVHAKSEGSKFEYHWCAWPGFSG